MDGKQQTMKMGWSRFAAMIATSTAVMFLLMYHLVFSLDHAMFSINRLIASLIMGAIMSAIMLAFMWAMYRGHKPRVGVLAGSLVIAMALLAVNRSQAMVDDTRFMKAMIPHHSIAINNARKAQISDPRVRRLADKIIESQVREIAEMKLLIDDIERNGSRGSIALPARTARIEPDMRSQIERAVR